MATAAAHPVVRYGLAILGGLLGAGVGMYFVAALTVIMVELVTLAATGDWGRFSGPLMGRPDFLIVTSFIGAVLGLGGGFWLVLALRWRGFLWIGLGLLITVPLVGLVTYYLSATAR